MQYICKINSTTGRRGEIIERPQDERTRQLLERGIIEAYTPPEPPTKKRRRKGGDQPEQATTDAVERKEEG